ncbi:MAG: amidohydrolase family protein, partial [Ignavibacteria bacterium]
MKIDCHAHILPQTWPSLKEKFGYGGFITLDHHQPGRARMMRDDGMFFREIEENCWNPTAILADMDKYNVDVMVLCTVPVLFSYWAKPEHALEWSMFLNDHLAGVAMDNPQRFIGLGTLPMQDVALACRELRRVVTELGMPGVEIGS